MSLNTVSEIQTEFLIRNNRTTTDGFITDATLNNWLREAHQWAIAYKKWPFTEGRVSTTFASLVTDEDGNLRGEYPEGWKPDSIRIMKIDGKNVQKMNFQQFQQWREASPDANGTRSRRFTDYGRSYYLSPKIDLGGTIAVWGQYTPALDPTIKTSQTVFSNSDEYGNDAIVERMTSYLKRREHLLSESNEHAQIASNKLNDIWTAIMAEQYGYHGGDVGMFEHIDVITGGFRADINNPRRWA